MSLLEVFMLIWYRPEKALDQRKDVTHLGVSVSWGLTVFHDNLHLIGVIIYGRATMSVFTHDLLQSLQKLFICKDISRYKIKPQNRGLDIVKGYCFLISKLKDPGMMGCPRSLRHEFIRSRFHVHYFLPA